LLILFHRCQARFHRTRLRGDALIADRLIPVLSGLGLRLRGLPVLRLRVARLRLCWLWLCWLRGLAELWLLWFRGRVGLVHLERAIDVRRDFVAVHVYVHPLTQILLVTELSRRGRAGCCTLRGRLPASTSGIGFGIEKKLAP
jgi:hypothetical protein